MRKLAWFTAGFSLLCLLAVYAPSNYLIPAGQCAVAAALLFGILCLIPLFRLPLRRVFTLFLGAAVAAGWVLGWSALFRAPAEALAGEEGPFVGTVTSYARPTAVGSRDMTLRLENGVKVQLYVSAEGDEFLPGDTVSFSASLEATDTYNASGGVFLTGNCPTPPTLLSRPKSIPFRYLPAYCAKALRESISAAFDAQTGPLALAVTTGDKSGLQDTVTSAFSRTGVSHTVAVSGMHLSFLVSAACLLMGNRRRLSALCIPLLLFFALMVGGTPSALRAVIMQSALLLAPLFRRENDSPSSLSFALLVLLLVNPYCIGSVGLQLSFAAVAGILLFSAPISRWFLRPFSENRHSPLLPPARALAASLSTSVSAMVFTQPLLSIYFGQFSLVFPITNLLLLWAVSLFFVAALLIGLIGIVLPAVAAFLAPAPALLGRYILWVVSCLGGSPLSSVDTGQFYYLLCLISLYLFLAVRVIFRRHPIRFAIPAGCFALLLAAAICFSRAPLAAPLAVTALDVGQGSSTAILSRGKTCLVDCGGSDAGDVAADYFGSMGHRALDLLVLTHFDSDHCNGLEQLFERMDVSQVAVPAPCPEEIARLCSREGASVTVVSHVRRLTLGDAALTLYPPLDSGNSNESGLFFFCTAEDFEVLITGDADSGLEKELIWYYNIPDIDLLVAGHHGAAGSTGEALLDALRPELVMISAGENNRYGHPAQAVLSRLEQRNIQIFRTDLNGSVSITVRSDGYAAQSQK